MEIIVHNIRSLFNVGAFFRNADGFGVKHIYLTGYTATPPRVEIAKTALGADKTVEWSKEADVLDLIERLKKEGKRIVAFESNEDFTKLDGLKVDADDDLVLVFGNEPDGLIDDILEVATDRVIIPMQGEKTSLNVAVASGIAMYTLSQKAQSL